MNARLAATDILNFDHKSALSWSVARALARDLTARRTAEFIGLYEQRVDRATDILLSAAVTPGNPLQRYLTRLSTFTTSRDRAGALTHAARAALRLRLLPEAA